MSATIVLQYNRFSCSGKHVHMAWIHCDETSVTLHGNTFQRNNRYAAVDLNLPNVPMIHITENTFVSLQGGALSLRLGRAVDSGVNSVVISDNVFTDVGRAQSAVSVTCYSGSSNILNITLTRNDFYSNLATTTLVTNCGGLFVTENVFANPLATRDYEVQVQYEHIATMFAPLNYWNATTFGEIAVRIYDYADDLSKSVVEVSPWYIDQNRTQTASGKNEFFKGPFEIGGLMDSDITVSSTEQSYRVTQNIIIPHGRRLVIEAGVQLLFVGSGIIVEGECSLILYVH